MVVLSIDFLFEIFETIYNIKSYEEALKFAEDHKLPLTLPSKFSLLLDKAYLLDEYIKKLSPNQGGYLRDLARESPLKLEPIEKLYMYEVGLFNNKHATGIYNLLEKFLKDQFQLKERFTEFYIKYPFEVYATLIYEFKLEPPLKIFLDDNRITFFPLLNKRILQKYIGINGETLSEYLVSHPVTVSKVDTPFVILMHQSVEDLVEFSNVLRYESERLDDVFLPTYAGAYAYALFFDYKKYFPVNDPALEFNPEYYVITNHFSELHYDAYPNREALVREYVVRYPTFIFPVNLKRVRFMSKQPEIYLSVKPTYFEQTLLEYFEEDNYQKNLLVKDKFPDRLPGNVYLGLIFEEQLKELTIALYSTTYLHDNPEKMPNEVLTRSLLVGMLKVKDVKLKYYYWNDIYRVTQWYNVEPSKILNLILVNTLQPLYNVIPNGSICENKEDVLGDELPNTYVITYGTFEKFFCYSPNELLSAFVVDEDKAIVKWTDPRGPVSRPFTNIHNLKEEIDIALGNFKIIDPIMIELINLIEAGLDIEANLPLRVNKIDDKDSFKTFLNFLFDAGMYQRGWRPGNPLPMKKQDSLNCDLLYMQDSMEKSLTEAKDIYNKMAQDDKTIISSLPVVTYTNNQFTSIDMKIIDLINSILSAESCIAYASSLLIYVAYYYNTLLGVELPYSDKNFNIYEFEQASTHRSQTGDILANVD